MAPTTVEIRIRLRSLKSVVVMKVRPAMASTDTVATAQPPRENDRKRPASRTSRQVAAKSGRRAVPVIGDCTRKTIGGARKVA